MHIVLRAYDHLTVLRAELLPVQRLWALLGSDGLRDKTKVRAGLHDPGDAFAREAVAARLESLVQEGQAENSLRYLRGGEPATLVTLRRAHWPVIPLEEAVALREDLVRYLTYGLWQAPEEVVAGALATLTGSSDASFLLGGSAATGRLREVLESVDDDEAFAARYGPVVSETLRAAGKPVDDLALTAELARLGQLLGPVRRLLRGAESASLRVLAYQDTPGGDGLTRCLAAAFQPGATEDVP
jgi:hypothetical protein